MIRNVFKRIILQVTQPNSTVSGTIELEKSIVAINGLAMISNRNDLLYYNGAQRIEINKVEVFPEDYDSQLLMSGLSVPPNLKYYKIKNTDPGNGIVKIDYTDTSSNQTAIFQPYTVKLWMECDMED